MIEYELDDYELADLAREAAYDDLTTPPILCGIAECCHASLDCCTDCGRDLCFDHLGCDKPTCPNDPANWIQIEADDDQPF